MVDRGPCGPLEWGRVPEGVWRWETGPLSLRLWAHPAPLKGEPLSGSQHRKLQAALDSAAPKGEPLTGGRVKASPRRGGVCEADGRVLHFPEGTTYRDIFAPTSCRTVKNKISRFRWFVGRGLDPAAGVSRQVQRSRATKPLRPLRGQLP